MIRVRAVLKKGTANYISLERLINVYFVKKYELLLFWVPRGGIAKMAAKMTMRHSIR